MIIDYFTQDCMEKMLKEKDYKTIDILFPFFAVLVDRATKYCKEAP